MSKKQTGAVSNIPLFGMPQRSSIPDLLTPCFYVVQYTYAPISAGAFLSEVSIS